MNFKKFLRKPFLQNTSGGCFWNLLHKLKNETSQSKILNSMNTIVSLVWIDVYEFTIYSKQFLYNGSTWSHFMPLKNITKSLFFWRFPGVQKENSGMKWVKILLQLLHQACYLKLHSLKRIQNFSEIYLFIISITVSFFKFNCNLQTMVLNTYNILAYPKRIGMQRTIILLSRVHSQQFQNLSICVKNKTHFACYGRKRNQSCCF